MDLSEHIYDCGAFWNPAMLKERTNFLTVLLAVLIANSYRKGRGFVVFATVIDYDFIIVSGHVAQKMQLNQHNPETTGSGSFH